MLALRRRMAKNHTCLLLLSMGTPMLTGGDEFLRTQWGNNNAYCQDNPLAWFDWDHAAREDGMQRFVAKLIAFTRRCDVVQRRKCQTDSAGCTTADNGTRDVRWYGTDLAAPHWDDPQARTLCLAFGSGAAPIDPDHDAAHYVVLMICHAGANMQPVQLPPAPLGTRGYRVIDTSLPDGQDIVDAGGITARWCCWRGPPRQAHPVSPPRPARTCSRTRARSG